MKIEVAKKMISILLIILIVSICLTLVLIRKAANDRDPEIPDVDGTSDSEPDSDSAPDSDDPVDSGTPPASDPVTPGSSEPPVVDPPVVDPPVVDPPVVDPPVVDPPVVDPPTPDEPTKAPEGFALDRVFTTDTGVRINMIAECHATRNSDGSVNLTVELYLEHHALAVGARNCTLKVGDVTQKFTSPRISQDGNKKTKLLLQSVSGTFAYGETVEIAAKVPVGLTNYGGVEIKSLNINESIVLK